MRFWQSEKRLLHHKYRENAKADEEIRVGINKASERTRKEEGIWQIKNYAD